MLTNKQIDKELAGVPGFKGCLCKNQLPERFKPATPGLWVINLMDSDGPGSHWVALEVSKVRSSCYVDSYGCPPPDIVQTFAQTAERPLWYSHAVVQDLDTEDCGAFACYFVRQMAKGRTVDNILNKDFSSDFRKNSAVVDSAMKHVGAGYGAPS